MTGLEEIIEARKRLKRLASLEHDFPILVCDGCGACFPDDDASDNESCDVCGRFKQRMQWAKTTDVAKDAMKAIAAADLAERVKAFRHAFADPLARGVETAELRGGTVVPMNIHIDKARELLALLTKGSDAGDL